MTSPWGFAGSSGVAVVLAVLAAVLFGLAAVRQHDVVRGSGFGRTRGLGGQVAASWRLLRTPAWLFGAIQGLAGGGLHIVALALAPIALVQPVGVLAVPVTVVAAAWRQRRRPPTAQMVGAIVSILSIAVLTLLLLIPGAVPSTVPSPARLVTTVVAILTGSAALLLVGRRRTALIRCTCLAVGAALLFGLTSTLVRLVTRILADGVPAGQRPDLVVAAASMVLAIPAGVWALQTAYAAGSAPVVICCITLIDPLTAVAGGAWLLRERFALDPLALVVVGCCAGLTAIGVVLLSTGHPDRPESSTRSVAAGRRTATTRPRPAAAPETADPETADPETADPEKSARP